MDSWAARDRRERWPGPRALGRVKGADPYVVADWLPAWPCLPMFSCPVAVARANDASWITGWLPGCSPELPNSSPMGVFARRLQARPLLANSWSSRNHRCHLRRQPTRAHTLTHRIVIFVVHLSCRCRPWPVRAACLVFNLAEAFLPRPNSHGMAAPASTSIWV